LAEKYYAQPHLAVFFWPMSSEWLPAPDVEPYQWRV